MPKQLEEELRRRARSKGFTGKRADRYTFGTMRKTGWKPSHQNPIAAEVTRRSKRKLPPKHAPALGRRRQEPPVTIPVERDKFRIHT